MTFPHGIDLLGTLALDRQQELIKAAAEQQMVRRARETHPAKRRWRRRGTLSGA